MNSIETLPGSCLICRKYLGEVPSPGGAIYADDLVYAGHTFLPEGQNETYLGSLVVEPIRHAPGLADLTNREAQAIGLLVARLSRALKAIEGAEHIYSFVLGHHIPHLHVFVVPRYPNTPREYWGLHVDEWPAAPKGNLQEISDLCSRLSTYLEKHP